MDSKKQKQQTGKETGRMSDSKEILTLAVEIGDVLLRSGGEIYRVEDTILHILNAFGLEEYDVYVLSNGIFASANEQKADACSIVRHVPLGDVHLGDRKSVV